MSGQTANMSSYHTCDICGESDFYHGRTVTNNADGSLLFLCKSCYETSGDRYSEATNQEICVEMDDGEWDD